MSLLAGSCTDRVAATPCWQAGTCHDAWEPCLWTLPCLTTSAGNPTMRRTRRHSTIGEGSSRKNIPSRANSRLMLPSKLPRRACASVERRRPLRLQLLLHHRARRQLRQRMEPPALMARSVPYLARKVSAAPCRCLVLTSPRSPKRPRQQRQARRRPALRRASAARLASRPERASSPRPSRLKQKSRSPSSGSSAPCTGTTTRQGSSSRWQRRRG
mmetsp:Transcript_21797/g.41750  ORF Transcript_21797/g.41750 Transcript_21797/m.41750 type:complete len:215 (+) Transcript_21797:14-658(+)